MSAAEMKAYRERKKLKLAAPAQGSGLAPSGLADTSSTVSVTPTRKRPIDEVSQDNANLTEPQPDPDVTILEPAPLATVHATPLGPSALPKGGHLRCQ